MVSDLQHQGYIHVYNLCINLVLLVHWGTEPMPSRLFSKQLAHLDTSLTFQILFFSIVYDFDLNYLGRKNSFKIHTLSQK